MERIKNVTVSSRRSMQIRGQYFTMECSAEVNLDGLDDKDKRECVDGAWNFVNNEVDNQLLQVQVDLKSKDKEE